MSPLTCSRIKSGVFALFLLLLGTGLGFAEDWPQFRGISGQGCSQDKSLPVQWEPDSANVRWKTAIRGEGASSPVVSEGRVYLTTAYEYEHPWDRSVVLLVTVLCLVALSFWIVLLPKTVRFIIQTAPGRRRRWLSWCGVGLYSAVVVIAAVAILARPAWFWRLPDPWNGISTSDPELRFVEPLQLRGAFVLAAGQVVLFFALLALQARRQRHLPDQPLPGMSRWLMGMTALCSLVVIVAIGLVNGWSQWFWNPGQPWLTWLISSGLVLIALAVTTGWLTAPGWKRMAWLGLVWLVAGWLFWHIPLDEINLPVELPIRLAAFAPGALFLLSQTVAAWLARGQTWQTAPAGRWFSAILAGLALVFFVRVNYVQPLSGMHRAVVCLDEQTGATLWETTVLVAPTEKKHTLNTYATPTPTADGQRVYADFGCATAALDRDGRLLWLKRDPEYRRFTRYGAGSSPVLGGSLLFVYRDHEWMGDGDTPDNNAVPHPSALIAYDKITGEERWRASHRFSHDSYMTPLLWSHQGRQEVVIATWETLAAFDPETGELRWQHAYPMWQIVPSLLVHGDTLIASGGNNLPPQMVAIRPRYGNEPGQTLWKNKKGVPLISTPVCLEGLIYSVSDNGILSCRDADTGKLCWDLRLSGRFLASLVAGDDKVYALNDRGVMFVLAAGRDHPKGLAKNEFAEACSATPAIANGCLFVRTEKHLYCIQSGE